MSSPAPATTRIALAPTPGFCVKSSALNAALLTLSGPDHAATKTALPIPIDRKVFVNIAWDKHVPAPPARSEAAIERAIAGDVALSGPADPEDWYVPVIVPEPRADTDKAGKPSVVFDCIFSASLKPRALRSPEFKTFLVELAFQRIETQYGVQLSRQIGTPNIAAKGKLAPRTVNVPTALLAPVPSLAPSSPSPLSVNVPPVNPAGKPGKPLIEEVSAPAPAAKGILKASASDPEKAKAVVLALSWTKTDDGRLRIALSVPHLTHTSIPHTTLDLEPRRILFSAPSPSPSPSSLSSPPCALDLDLSLPDAEIERIYAENGAETRTAALGLKRERPLDVDGARAEWRVGDGVLVIYA